MSTLDAQQQEWLRRTITWARGIEEQLAVVREQHLGEVHFRPSAGGVAMIGLRPDRPQRGRSGIRGLARLADDFEAQFRRHCVDCEQGRPTPEKRLQSQLLANAYRQGRQLDDLTDDESGIAPLFVTDELALPTADGRIVCDLLALHGSRPAVIELKPERLLTRLVAQVTAYAELVETHLSLFAELFSVVLGRPVALEQPCERWIVWPQTHRGGQDPREDELAALGVRVVGYDESDNGFGFRVGRAVVPGSPDNRGGVGEETGVGEELEDSQIRGVIGGSK